MNDVSFWDDKEYADIVISKMTELRQIVEPIRMMKENILSNLEIINGLEDDYDQEIFELMENEYDILSKDLDIYELRTFLDGEYDKNNCLLEIHAGAGGTESCDWVSMLSRMYLRYCKKNDYDIKEIDNQPGEEVGYKSIVYLIKGNFAYGYLKHEKGVHRLVRISPFDSNKRRHTSFASVEVLPEVDKNIDVEIKESDLKIDVFRSSGAGGQSVNTTDSAVRITHLPTNIVVTCQNERSQLQNKEQAMEILKSKLYNLEMEKQNDKLNQMTEGQMSIGFGSGKRSYVMCPYTLVKDNESGYESSNVDAILDGEIDNIILEGLRSKK